MQLRGIPTSAVADLVFGMLISLYRNIIPCDRVCRQGGTKDGLVGVELEGRKFGVVGTGAIGLRVARLPRPLDARYWHTAGLSRMWRESVL